MQTIAEHEEMTAWSVKEKRKGATIGLVPTMGYLHAGHVSLMRVMRPLVDRVVVSSYVNPLQFGVDEDLDRYPSDPVGDAEKCRAAGVDCLFVPSDIYPDGFRTAVMVHELTDGLCGASRPGHFEGVTTVVSRLFGLTRCDVAIFGEKDFQQLAVIRRMVRDLAMPVQVIGAPLIRADDGVALSRRNAYLSDHQRSMARTLSSALFAMAREASGGGK